MPNQFTHPWTSEEINFLEKNIGKLTYQQIGALINRSYSSIQSKIRYLPFQKKVKKHSANYNFFKTWSPEMAYVLGLIASDGNICHSGRSHTLHLASDDKDVIEKTKVLISYTGPIHEKKRDNGKTSYSLRICDKTIFNDLKMLGITERKSLTFNPTQIKKQFTNHFIRGFFDGDGTVFSSKHPIYTSQKLGVRFYTASLPMAKYLYNVVKPLFKKYQGKIVFHLAHQKTRYYSLSFSYNNSKLLFEYMYKNSNGLYMQRKYNKFIEGIYGT
jgi:hypothetical protein